MMIVLGSACNENSTQSLNREENGVPGQTVSAYQWRRTRRCFPCGDS